MEVSRRTLTRNLLWVLVADADSRRCSGVLGRVERGDPMPRRGARLYPQATSVVDERPAVGDRACRAARRQGTEGGGETGSAGTDDRRVARAPHGAG